VKIEEKRESMLTNAYKALDKQASSHIGLIYIIDEMFIWISSPT